MPITNRELCQYSIIIKMFQPPKSYIIDFEERHADSSEPHLKITLHTAVMIVTSNRKLYLFLRRMERWKKNS